MVQLKMWIRKLMMTKANDLFRYKGVLAIAGTQQKYVFQGVHMLFSGNLEPAHLWKDDEVRDCRFVFIGRNLDKEELQKGIMDCKVEPLRFEGGDCVEARVMDGLWVKGRVYDIWDGGYPYTIALDKELGIETCITWCWAPLDTDEFVRKAS